MKMNMNFSSHLKVSVCVCACVHVPACARVHGVCMHVFISPQSEMKMNMNFSSHLKVSACVCACVRTCVRVHNNAASTRRAAQIAGSMQEVMRMISEHS